MKRICNLPIYQYLILGLLLVLLNSCDTEVDPKLLPVLTTTEVLKMTEATAYSGGNITSDAGNDVISRGVCWSESPNPTIEDKKTNDAAGTGEFESRIVGLNPSTTYYIRAYATNKKGVGYGLQVTFKTKSLSITTTPITAATINTAFSGGTIVTDGDSLNVTERGICWNTSANPTILNSKMANGKGKGNYSGSMSDLQIATQYYVRAYATNLTGTFYGDEIIFNTTNGSMTLTTTAATSITATSATIGGNVPSDGGSPVTERGLCISKLPAPTIANKIVNGNGGIGSFATNITSLEANTTYYVRVFATNSVGTVYGNEISFTTKDGVIALSTTAASAITATSANIGGTITSDGGAAITVRGICWSTTTNPTTANSKSTNIGGIGSFASNITGLNNGAIYYAKVFATNSFGTVYGNEISFTTKDGMIVITTAATTAISDNTATSGGNIISDGGATVTTRGVCWSTSPSPTIANSKTSDGTGTGAFISSLSGLVVGTTYYVRAFATNSVGTVYGTDVSFTATFTVGSINTVLIPAGTFTMGSPINEANRSSEEIQHQVTLSAFRMSKYEITNKQYAAFLNATGIGSNGKYSTGMYPTQTLIHNNSSWGVTYNGNIWVAVTGYENAPVTNVTWYGANEFAAYVGGTLPTEAQWEYACRAGTTSPFYTGNCLTNLQANYNWAYPYSTCSNTITTSPNKPKSIGSYAPNAFGVYDMHGNVYEWCSDWYSGTYPTAAQTNPTGATTGTLRIYRGGGWGSNAHYCRSANRTFDYPHSYYNATGFRLVFAP